MRTENKQRLKQLRRWRTRKKVKGTSDRPRMSVHFSGQHIYVQFVDDASRVTLASMSTRSKVAGFAESKLGANIKSAEIIGAAAAAAARTKNIEKVVFDRSGAKFHGKVKALAEAARAAGLKF